MSDFLMCAVCGKAPHTGQLVSHSNRKTKRVVKPNLQTYLGRLVCTRCLRTLMKSAPRKKRLVRKGS